MVRCAEGLGASIEDIEQNGMLGLINAAKKFDPLRGVKFSTFAHWWVFQSLSVLLRKLTTAGETFFKSAADDECLIEMADPSTARSECKGRDIRGEVAGLLDGLECRDAQVLRLRFGFDCEPMTLGDIGEVLNVSRERVRQIEARALASLRTTLEA